MLAALVSIAVGSNGAISGAKIASRVATTIAPIPAIAERLRRSRQSASCQSERCLPLSAISVLRARPRAGVETALTLVAPLTEVLRCTDWRGATPAAPVDASPGRAPTAEDFMNEAPGLAVVVREVRDPVERVRGD